MLEDKRLKDKQLELEKLKQKEFDEKMEKITFKTIDVYDKLLDYINFKLDINIDKVNPKK